MTFKLDSSFTVLSAVEIKGGYKPKKQSLLYAAQSFFLKMKSKDDDEVGINFIEPKSYSDFHLVC